MCNRTTGALVKSLKLMVLGLWRTIRNFLLDFKNSSEIIAGRGDNTKFWTDDWRGNGILSDLFPGLLSICTNRDSRIE